MSLFHSKGNRRILPRWRVSSDASKTADFLALKKPAGALKASGASEALWRQATDDFIRLPTIGSAAEALSYSLIAGRIDAAISSAKFLLENESITPLTLLNLAKSVIKESVPNDIAELSSKEKIAKTRKLLRINPRDAMLWADMARHYSSMGNKTSACRSMISALQLAPNHRWMLRTASRFFVHQEESVVAHKLLASNPATPNDPWLIAAELACAQVAKRSTRFWSKATNILKWDALPPQHTSELAIAVAMMELEAGDRKKARKYVMKGLVAPTENTLAQVYWAHQNKHLNGSAGLALLIQKTEDAFEADYRLNLVNGNLLAALGGAQTWRIDEPFAARPCIEIAYVASLLDNYDLAIKMADDVRRLDSHIDSTFEMNTIFAQLSSRKLDKNKDVKQIGNIKRTLMKVIEEDKNSYHAVANLGLWYYRYGEKSEGGRLYREAANLAQKLNHNEAAAMATTYAAREAILASETSAEAILKHARELAKNTKNAPNKFYLRKVDALARKPEDADEILSPATAHKFLKQPKAVASVRVEHTKKGDILWMPGRRDRA